MSRGYFATEVAVSFGKSVGLCAGRTEASVGAVHEDRQRRLQVTFRALRDSPVFLDDPQNVSDPVRRLHGFYLVQPADSLLFVLPSFKYAQKLNCFCFWGADGLHVCYCTSSPDFEVVFSFFRVWGCRYQLRVAFLLRDLWLEDFQKLPELSFGLARLFDKRLVEGGVEYSSQLLF